MALDQNGTTVTGWVDADIADRKRFGQAKWERLIQNQIALNNLVAAENNHWSRGSNVWSHFAAPIPDISDEFFEGGSAHAAKIYELVDFYSIGSPTHDEVNHKYSLAALKGIFSSLHLQADKVPMVWEARVEVGSHGGGGSDTLRVGLCNDSNGTAREDTLPSSWTPRDGCYFEEGTNANTWKVITRKDDADSTVTDNRPGNYISWDILKIIFDGTDAEFYINGVLDTTHTVTLPTDALLQACAMRDNRGFDLDYMSLRARDNTDSA